MVDVRTDAGVRLSRLPKKNPESRTRFGMSLFHPAREKPTCPSGRSTHNSSGRSSDSRIVLATAPSRRSKPVASRGPRPRSQRRARPRFSRGSLLGSFEHPNKDGTIKERQKNVKSKTECKRNVPVQRNRSRKAAMSEPPFPTTRNRKKTCKTPVDHGLKRIVEISIRFAVKSDVCFFHIFSVLSNFRESKDNASMFDLSFNTQFVMINEKLSITG